MTSQSRKNSNKLRKWLSVLDFGATGDGVTDDSGAFQSAADYAASLAPESPTIFIPAGDYLIGATVSISSDIELEGEGSGTYGTRIFASDALNADLFFVTSGARFKSITIVGSDVGVNSSETLVHIEGANNVSLDNVALFNSYTALLVDGASSSFYLSIDRCRFQNTNGAFIKIDNSSASGVDLIMSHTRFLGKMGGFCWQIENGLGSIIASDVVISVTGAAPTQHLCYFGTPATLYGGAQFTGCVFENTGAVPTGASVYLNGAPGNPWRGMHFVNCLITANLGPSLVVGYTDDVNFTDCTFASSNVTANIQFAAAVSSIGVRMTSCRYESLSAAPVIHALADTVIGLGVTLPVWKGASSFIDFSSVTPAQLTLDVIGGNVGTAATPIVLSNYTNTKKNISTHGDNYGPLQRKTLVGTLDGAGAASVAHGITSGQVRVVQVEAWGKGGSGEMVKLTVATVDGANIAISGGTASAKYRVHVLYTTEVDTNW